MGVFAQTDITIECRNKLSAKAVAQVIRKLQKDNNKNGEDFNYDFSRLKVSDNFVDLYKSSGRIQNLEYQCEILWEAIKGIKGVIEMNCPFMTESDGIYFNLDDDEDDNKPNKCDICHKPEDDDGRCGCTNDDSK